VLTIAEPGSSVLNIAMRVSRLPESKAASASSEGLRAIWPYMASLILGLILVAAVPWISIGFLR
jgi:TRAP-type C4-dicarboxylate transport system permease large subunit